MKVAVLRNIRFFKPGLIWVMVVLLLGGQVIDSKMGAGWIGEEISPPSSLLDLKFFPLSHIHISCLFLLVTELLIGPISSRGEDCYNINPLPIIIN